MYPLLEQFTVTPSYCTKSISYTAPGLETYIQWDEGSQTFTFPQISDSLSLSGDTQQTYTVTVTYETQDFHGVTRSTTPAAFVFTIKNPCIDQTYVTIEAPTYTKKTYIIDSVVDPFDPEGEFTVETWPVAGHTLCGDLSFVAKYDNVLMDGDPMSYNEVTR